MCESNNGLVSNGTGGQMDEMKWHSASYGCGRGDDISYGNLWRNDDMGPFVNKWDERVHCVKVSVRVHCCSITFV